MSKDIAAVTGLQREAYICKRAYELAASGYHIKPLTVVAALVREGYPDAPELLRIRPLREDLRKLCAASWRGVAAANDDDPEAALPPPEKLAPQAG
jgi:hypothetical protein